MIKNGEYYPIDTFDLEDLSNNISIYDAINVFNMSVCDVIDTAHSEDLYLDESWVSYDNMGTDIVDTIDVENYVEDCSTCYHRCKGRCLAKGIDVSIEDNYLENCWCYRDAITMRPSNDFQDDYSDIYDDFN